MDRYYNYDKYITVLTKDRHPDFLSEGERQMARLFYRYDIPFFYEEPVEVTRWGRQHVWNPDFLLPSFNFLVVEYAGVKDDPEYDQLLENKLRTYKKEKIPVEVIWPHEIEGERWPTRVLAKLAGAARKAGWKRYYGWVLDHTNLEGTLWGTCRKIRS